MTDPAAPGWRAGQSVTIVTPASSANLGPAFDSVGIALGLFDRCVARVSAAEGVHVVIEGEGSGVLPSDGSHLVARTMLDTWDHVGIRPPPGLHLACVNEVPHGRGLGSSATAIVTGAAAAYGLARLARGAEASLDREAINDLASAWEGHPDNASASVFGGMTLSWSDDAETRGGFARTRTVRLPIHRDLAPVVFVPEHELSTATARSILPTHVRLGDAAANAARAALLVHAVTTEPDLLLAATRDWLHQEARRPSYASSMALLDSLRGKGHAATISGAGPAVLVIGRRARLREVIATAPVGWRALAPGFAENGVTIEVATGP